MVILLRVLILLAAVIVSRGAFAQCPTVPTACPSPTYYQPTLVNPSTTGGHVAVKNVTTTYASTTSDNFICVTASGPVTITLAASPPAGFTQTVDDCGGSAASHNITVAPASGSIMGFTNVLINQNNEAIGFLYTGTTWVIN